MTIAYKLVAGDTLSYYTAPPTGDSVTYAATAGWTLKYRLVPRDSGASAIDLTATAEGEGYRIAAIAADTASWAPGEYSAAAWVEQGTLVYTVEPAFSQLTILPNPRTVAPGYDGRTRAQKAIDDLEAALATYTASNGTVAEYEIDTGTGRRRMKFRAADEIDNLLAYWRRIRARELRDDAIARGLADPRRGYVRLTPNG